jgi:pimeloyl-ACP methyl ester carboxylesterase
MTTIMPRVESNGLELEYDVIGRGEPLVLIMGIGAQLIYWQEDFCHQLAERGFRVVRFDNRDVGLSSKLKGRKAPPFPHLLSRSLLGRPIEAPYSLSDMADDTVGLMDALGFERAHVVGASMGGMIAQTLAITHPHRVRSLVSIMSNPGGRRHLVARPRAMKALLQAAPTSREEAMDRAEAFYTICGSTGFERDVSGIRERAGRAYERCFYPQGFVRQMAAIFATGSRQQALKFVRAPTLVIHGSVDPLILPRGGRATAAAIPDSRLEIVEGMGHDLPRGAWPRIIDAITSNARRG